MSNDFLIKYEIATRWEGKVHYIMAPPLEQIDALMPMLHQLIQGLTDPSGDHVCPICDQIFEIHFYTAPLTTDPLIIATNCKTCNIHIFFRSNNIPSWAKEAPINEWLEELRESGDKNA